MRLLRDQPVLGRPYRSLRRGGSRPLAESECLQLKSTQQDDQNRIQTIFGYYSICSALLVLPLLFFSNKFSQTGHHAIIRNKYPSPFFSVQNIKEVTHKAAYKSLLSHPLLFFYFFKKAVLNFYVNNCLFFSSFYRNQLLHTNELKTT